VCFLCNAIHLHNPYLHIQFIHIESSSESNSDNVHDSETKSQVRPKPIIHCIAAAAPGGSTATSTSAGASKGKALAKPMKVKSEVPVKTESIPLQQAPNNNLNGLPKWAKASWSMSFLPTLYTYLSAATKPFELYVKGSNLLATIQEVADIVYPGSGYHIKLMDKILYTLW
jgi:hypothetical protein